MATVDSMITCLKKLREALQNATNYGLLDDLASDIHPDIINKFCDAVKEFEVFDCDEIMDTFDDSWADF